MSIENIEKGIINTKKNKWEYVIGLEVHAQIKSKRKLFSKSSTEYSAKPNKNVSLIDIACPGTLPILNEFCIYQAVRTGLSLNCDIQKKSIFDRKHYFYPDLPQGYQISQFYHPIALNGFLDINSDGLKVILERIHVEQDAGKSIHLNSESIIDLNRSGIPLMEIVTKPCIKSPEDAGLFLKKLRNLLRYIDTCDGDMEKGSLRCDANVSVRKVGETSLNTRCEIKNLNSIRFLIQAIKYEANRQINLYENNGQVIQETRLFDSIKGITISMRSKEDAADYRYFPDPDLLPVILTDEYIEEAKKQIPELPMQRSARYQSEYGIKIATAELLVENREITKYFEAVLSYKNLDPIIVSNIITTQYFALLNKNKINFSFDKITPQNIAKLSNLIKEGKLNNQTTKKVFEKMFDSDNDPSKIMLDLGIGQMLDSDELELIVNEVISKNQKVVEQFKNGENKVLGFLIGQIMKSAKGQTNPAIAKEMLIKNINQ